MSNFEKRENLKECAYEVIFNCCESVFEGFVEAIRFVYNETGYLSNYVVYENDSDFFEENYKNDIFDLVEKLNRYDCQYDFYSDYVKLDDYNELISYDVTDLKEEYAQHFNEIFEHLINCPECYYLLDDYVVEVIEEYNSIN